MNHGTKENQGCLMYHDAQGNHRALMYQDIGDL